MLKKQFKDYTPRQNGTRSIDEACAEIQREMDVRKRLFDRWVADGKMSWMDAHDRMERHMSALHHLITMSKMMEDLETRANNPTANIVPLPDKTTINNNVDSSENGLDDSPAAAAM